MKLLGMISTAALSLTLGIAAPIYAQEQRDQKQDKQPQQEEKTAQRQDKNTKPEGKTAQQQDKSVKQEHTQETRTETHYNGRIPEDHFRANFGREHVFVINRPVIVEGHPRFQYGGYWFGFAEPWPVGWYYTDNVYVDYIDGGYYLYNPVHPGFRIVVNVF